MNLSAGDSFTSATHHSIGRNINLKGGKAELDGNVVYGNSYVQSQGGGLSLSSCDSLNGAGGTVAIGSGSGLYKEGRKPQLKKEYWRS